MSTDLIEQPANELRTIPAESVSVEQMLMHAIDRGVDPAALEKLVALQERVQAKRAESAFIAAMMAFKRACPRLVHNCRVKEGSLDYSYLDLSGMTDIVDPVLAEHGLTYSFDCIMEQAAMRTECTIRHVDGHSQTSSFTCAIDGTRAMNQPQRAMSATTFGRRASLQLALGISTDKDDNGRAAAPPPDNPESKPDAPKAQPRGKRIEPGELKILFNAFHRQQKAINGSDSVEALVNWASAVCSLECNSETVIKVSTWTRQAFDEGMRSLKGYL